MGSNWRIGLRWHGAEWWSFQTLAGHLGQAFSAWRRSRTSWTVPRVLREVCPRTRWRTTSLLGEASVDASKAEGAPGGHTTPSCWLASFAKVWSAAVDPRPGQSNVQRRHVCWPGLQSFDPNVWRWQQAERQRLHPQRWDSLHGRRVRWLWGQWLWWCLLPGWWHLLLRLWPWLWRHHWWGGVHGGCWWGDSARTWWSFTCSGGRIHQLLGLKKENAGTCSQPRFLPCGCHRHGWQWWCVQGAWKSLWGKGKSKGKGRGKSSGGKGKSVGKGHPLPGARRYVFGRRRAGDSTSTSSTTASAKSTTSGSTAQHGPRFKRYRLPANGIKEVPDEVAMVEDSYVSEVNQIPVDYSPHESINFVSQAVGWAIMDSGATRTVCGEAGWNKIVEYLSLRNMEPDIDKETKDFRFGDGAMVRSLFRAIIPVCVGKTWRQLTVHVLPGHTPLLLARPDLESWQTVVDYGRKTVMIGDVHVKPAFTTNGHYMINIFDDLEDVLSFAELANIDVSVETFVDAVITDEVSDFEADLEVEVSEKEAEEFVFAATMKSQQHERKLKFWEVYVDEGNLSKYLQRAYHDVEVRQFSLPTWNFEMKEQQAAFRRLAEQEEPHHIMVTPECRLWSPMQNLRPGVDDES